jgi:hypothetical protein
MTIEASFRHFQDFDITNSTISLWAFRKKTGAELDFSAKAILMTESLRQALKAAAISVKDRCTEVEQYSLLTQCTEAGVLALPINETAFGRLNAIVDRPAEENLITDKKQIENAVGYLIRLRSGDNVIYLIKKTGDSWKSRTARTVINVLLRVNQLEVVEDRTFSISKTFDCVVAGEHVLVANKPAFESLFNFKNQYVESFLTLQDDISFGSIFSEMALLIQHVGTNTMHLRRMEVIRQKQLYASPEFIQRLREVNGRRGWNITFDVNGRIVPTEETIKTILQVLLNHRLWVFR